MGYQFRSCKRPCHCVLWKIGRFQRKCARQGRITRDLIPINRRIKRSKMKIMPIFGGNWTLMISLQRFLLNKSLKVGDPEVMKRLQRRLESLNITDKPLVAKFKTNSEVSKDMADRGRKGDKVSELEKLTRRYDLRLDDEVNAGIDERFDPSRGLDFILNRISSRKPKHKKNGNRKIPIILPYERESCCLSKKKGHLCFHSAMTCKMSLDCF